MKKLLSLILAVLMALTIVSCGRSGDSGGDNTLKMGRLDEVTTMLPTQARQPVEQELMGLCYESLFRMDTNGDPKPWLIDSYEADADAATYTFHVKEGVTFQDGTALDAEAVAWNLNNYKANGVLSQSFFGSFENAEVVDDMTVVAHFTQFDSTWPAALTRCFWLESPTAVKANGEDSLNTTSCGTGPFKMTEWEQSVGMRFEKYDGYWQGDVKLDAVEYTFFTDTLTLQAALKVGDVQGFITSDYEVMNELRSDGYNTMSPAAPTTAVVMCYYCKDKTASGEDNPLADVRVRQAIGYAIDTKNIVKTLTFGLATETSQWCAPGSPYYNDEVDGQPYDVQKAKDLLAEAGYADGFTTKIKYWNAYTLYGNVAQAIAEDLAQIGITVEIEPCDMATFSGFIGNWEEGMFLHSQGVANGFASQTAANFRQGLTSGLGFDAWDIPDDLDAAVNKAMASTPDDAAQIWRDVQKLIVEDHTLYKTIMCIGEAGITSKEVKDLNYINSLPYLADWWNGYIDVQ